MGLIFRIALRNVLLQKKRSLVVGFAVMLSALLLLVSDSIMNGVERQVLKGYVNFQAGHVAVVWADMKEINNMDVSRFIQKLRSFNPEKDSENRKAVERLQSFLSQRADQVQAFYPTVRKFSQFQLSEDTANLMVYGLSESSKQFLLDSRTIVMKKGELPPGEDGAIAISEEVSKEYGLQIGAVINLKTVSSQGEKRSGQFTVKGIYANGAGYDNIYGFMSDQDAREFVGYGSDYFDAGKIYLKDMAQADAFARELDEYLMASSPVLRAESYKQASAFYTNIPQNLKFFFNMFVVFLLSIIAIGLRSTIGINIFQRMREFGTIRAIGFSKLQNYALIMFELTFVSVIAVLIALVIAGAFTLVFGKTGVYVGPGPVSYPLGGERFYPEMKGMDVLLSLSIIVLFSFLSTLGPGLRVCNHKITDLLLNRQQKISLVREFLKKASTSRGECNP